MPTTLLASDKKMPEIEFSIKPNLCVLSNDETACHDTLEIRWRVTEPIDVCLYQSDKRLPLRCWENELSGVHQVDIAISRNINFQLREVEDESLLAKRNFEVVQDTVKYRHRRRNAWSFF